MGEIRKIIFVCHGNICRSPMAECIMADLLAKAGIAGVEVSSAATSTEETGNDTNPRSLEQLARAGIPSRPHYAHRLTAREAEAADLIVGMDDYNMANLRRMVTPRQRAKLRKLLDFTASPRDVDDPWYTGDYSVAFADIMEGCRALLAFLRGGSQ